MAILLEDFIRNIHAGIPVTFDQSITVINDNYQYEPVEFENGLGAGKVVNEAGKNEGSCRIFAFAQLQQFNKEQTLSLFGDYYRVDVLQNPEATDHQNIRQFMQHGWEGLHFKGTALVKK